jgi:anti-sigma B factor antagonist
MHFTTEQGDAKTVFRLKEERLDSRNAGQLKAEFLILAQPDIDALIVDLNSVQHIDSAGISALLLAQRQMKLHSAELRLVGVRPDVLSMLRLTQLDRIFPIYNTVEEALAAEVVLSDDDEIEHEPNVEESDDLDLALGRKTAPTVHSPSLGPVAPTVSEIKAGAIAAGGSLGAAALAKIMMTPYDDELTTTSPLMAFGDPSMGEDDDFAEDDDLEDDDFEEDLDDEDLEDEEEEDLDEEDDAEEVDDDLIEDDDFEDDDFDDEELEEDEEEDY